LYLADELAQVNNYEWQYSIAVLPFATIDRTEESEIFSEGIHEDILSQIAKIRDIKVIARTSVLQYKDTRRRLKEIAEELGVMTILEGSVRRSGDKIRIVAQLIDANTEDHIWTGTYNRDYEDIFTIQSDVAIKIAGALQAALTIEEKQAIKEIPTDNLEAYEFFQQGQHGINSRGISIELENFDSEIALFEKAIKLDPAFVMAYSSLCEAHIMVYWYHEQIPKEHLQSAKLALNKAQNIDPNHSSVHIAEGYYYYYGYRDYDNALDKFQLALRKNPNDSDLLAAIGYVKRRQGKHVEALEYLKKSAEIDPQSSKKAHETGLTARLLRNWGVAEQFLIRATSISPQNIWAYLDRVELAIEKKGDLLESRKILENAFNYNDPTEMIWVRVFVEYMNRNYKNALKILNEYTNTNITDHSKILFYKGRVALAMNQRELADSYFDSLKTLGLYGLQTTPEDWIYHTYLYKAYAGLGMEEKFVKEYELLETLIPINKDVLVGTDRMVQKIECLIWLNEYDQAIDLVEQMLSVPSLLTINRLKLSPIYDPIRENLRFQEVLSKYGD
jgi:TolB-like protein/Tfp pilus assembly protein PilF